MTFVEPIVNVLHLSDLHFGVEPGGVRQETALARRTLVLSTLAEALVGLDDEWRPHVVVVSGDVGWRGQATDYEQATIWLRALLAGLGLGVDRFVVCAGNHDIDRGLAVGRGFPTGAVQAND